MFSNHLRTPGLKVRIQQSLIVGISLLMSPYALSAECQMDFSSPAMQNALSSMSAASPGAMDKQTFCSLDGLDPKSCAAQFDSCQDQISEQIRRDEQAAQQQRAQQPTNPNAAQSIASGSGNAMAAEVLFQGSFEEFKKQKESCLKKYKTARTACNPTKNDSMAQIGQAAAGIIDAMGQAGGQAACSGMGDLLKKALGALGAFRGQCGAFKGSCSSTCEEAVRMAKQASDSLQQCTSAALQPNARLNYVPGLQGLEPKQQAQKACFMAKAYFDSEAMEMTDRAKEIASQPADKEIPFDEKTEADRITLRDAVNLCASFKETLQKAAGNGLQMMNMSQASKQCEQAQDEAVAGALQDYCTQYPDTPECQKITEMDCSNPAIAAVDPTCICKENPESPSCKQLAATQGTEMSSSDVADFSSSKKEEDFALGDGGPPNMAPFASVKQPAGQGLGAGGGGAGGPSIGGGGAGGIQGGGGDGGGGGYSGAGYDENVILGSGGGRGGGGSGFRFSRRSASESNYKDYLPKVGAKAKLGKKDEKKDITGSGGPSNFDKVSQRYRANRRTLIPE